LKTDSIQVKICGITRPPDAIAAVEAGADAVGLMFYERSRRWVTLDQAREVARVLPEGIARVGVFVDADEATIGRAIEACGLHILQLHGAESPEFCKRFGSLRIWKAFRVAGPEVLGTMAKFDTDAWLLDAAAAGQMGGSGQRFDWELAVQARALGRPIVLAGGLTPENVREAVERVRPFAVDVSSGVESAPGVKDFAKMRAFVAAAKGTVGRWDGGTVGR
jgi:phosphoribosylanthranilate isomerase